MMRRVRPQAKASFALVITLLMVAAVTVIVVGFLASVQYERLNARSYLNVYKAQLAAQSGLQVALNQLSTNAGVVNFHYFTGLTNYPNANSTNLVLYFMQTGATNIIATNIISSSTNPNAVGIVSATNCESTPFYPGDPVWSKTITNAVSYIILTNSTGTEIGRYAYWAQDEGSKQNLNRWSGTPTENNLTNLAEMPLIRPDTNAFAASDLAAIKTAHGPDYIHSNAMAVPTVQTLNVVVPDPLSPPADVNNYTMESLSSYLTPEGYPKLNLSALKQLLDNNTKVYPGTATFPGAASSDFVLNYSDLTQGPHSARVVLVEELLNEDNNHKPDSQNPWGYGNLQYLETRYPTPTLANKTQARQIVANILNYLDNSIIPITDGTPGTSATDTTAQHPTFLGVKSWMIKGPSGTLVAGHPYINYLGPGYDIGQYYGSATYPNKGVYELSLLATIGLINPWTAPSISLQYYSAEVSAHVTGNCSTGAAISTFLPGGVLSSGGLLPNSSIPATSAFLLPKGQNSGYLYCFRSAQTYPAPQYANTPGMSFSQTPYLVDYCRLVLATSATTRYLIQDITSPLTAAASSGPQLSFTYGQHPVPSSDVFTTWSTQFTGYVSPSWPPTGAAYTDWHLITDPRLNFISANTWAALPSTASTTSPSLYPGVPTTSINIFKYMSSLEGDGVQNVAKTSSTWWTDPAVTNHFPTYAEGYHPRGTPIAALFPLPAASYSVVTQTNTIESTGELGFIHAGAPWQTLHLQPDSVGDPNPPQDYKLLDYVKVGDSKNYPETITNSSYERVNPPAATTFTPQGLVGRVDGLVNINTANAVTLAALYSGITSNYPSGSASIWSASVAHNLAEETRTNTVGPFNGISGLLSDTNIAPIVDPNKVLTDFQKEDWIRRIANGMTVQSQDFTIYVVGESRLKGKTLGKVTLRATVKLMETLNGGVLTLKPVVVSTAYE